MNIIKILSGTFITAIVLSSCQKEVSPESPSSPVSLKIKTYTEDVTSAGSHSITTFNLSYDGSDRLISMVSASSPGDKFIYQYSSGNFTLDLYNSNKLSIHEVFFINNNSFVDSTFQYNDTNDSMTEKYIYNSSKQLVTIKQYDYSKTTGSTLSNTESYTYGADGNPVKVTDDYTITTYDYYSSLLNNISPLIPYLPASKNLVKTTTLNDGSTTVVNHTYTFDTNNRITSEKDVVDNGDIFIKTYTY